MSERSKGPDRCEHRSLAAVEQAEWGYRLRCVACGKVGPARKTPEAAHKALLVLGVRDGAAPRGTGD